MYFPGSLRGLNHGAAVTLRGIKVGEVAEVKALLTGKPSPIIQIEVVIELVGDVLEAPPGVAQPLAGLTGPEQAKVLIARGVRGRLMSQSLLTGQKYIDFDFLPDEPARMSGLNPRYPELPTTPTAMEKLGDKAEDFMNKLADLPLDQMLENLRKTLAERAHPPRLARPPRCPGRRAAGHREAAAGRWRTSRAAVADARRLHGRRSTARRGRRPRTRGRRSAPRARLSTAQHRTMGTLETTLPRARTRRASRAAQTLEELEPRAQGPPQPRRLRPDPPRGRDPRQAEGRERK